MPNTIESMLAITQRNMKAYGEEVVEQRAVPDYRDGLKPVHRFILWASYTLGMHHGTKFRKAARTVGEVLGKFHPHGDQSCYDAMVRMAGTKSDDGKTWVTRNASIPLIEGYGNWGDNVDSAAAMRYTESRLSEFSTLYLLDPVYLAVSDYVPNFSEDEKVPLVLPAKLPVLLLNGSQSIAVGVSAETPSFGIDGVLNVVRRCLSGESITPAMCAKLLKFTPVYGGNCVSTAEDVLFFFKSGYGTIEFIPEFICDEKKQSITLTSFCPGLTSKASLETLATNLSASREVKAVSDASDKTGFRFEILSSRSLTFDEFKAHILRVVTRKQSYNIGVTHRELSGVKFARSTVSNIVKDWCAWRVALEVKVLNHLIKLDTEKLCRNQLLLLAVSNLKVIVASLSKDDSAAYLVQQLHISLEDANSILDMKVRQLKALERAKISATIKGLAFAIKALRNELKMPEQRVLGGLKNVCY